MSEPIRFTTYAACARHAMAVASAGFLSLPLASHATLITFDDLAPGTAVTTQYLDRGLTVIGGVIGGVAELGPTPIVSPPNALYDLFGPGLTLQFVGTLPTTVSMFVTAALEDWILLTAWGESGPLDSFETEGWRGLEELSTPAIPRQPVTLSGPGISSVTLGGFFNRRGDINIDNLSFSAAAIPEPSTALLVGIAFLLGFGRFRWRSTIGRSA